MKLTQRQLAVLKDFASDLLVFAASAEPGDVTRHMARSGVTETQLFHLLSDLGIPVKPDGTDVLLRVYRDVAGCEPPEDPGKRDEAFQRLSDCLDSIPAWDAWAALTAGYAGTFPDAARENRADDVPSPRPGDTAVLARLFSEAMRHLRHPSRVNYIVCGLTDIDLQESARQKLRQEARSVVKADLLRFTERQLTELFQDDEALLGQLFVYRYDQT